MSQEQPAYYQPSQRNYFQSGTDAVDGLKYRLDAKDIIKEIEDTLKAIDRDSMGKVISEHPEDRVVNEHGIIGAKIWLKSALGKITHLTKFENIEHINKQQRWLAKDWAFQITLHRKLWSIKNKDALQMMIEKQTYESMLRANDGFENGNISRSYNTHETIDRTPQQSQGWGLGRLFGGRS